MIYKLKDSEVAKVAYFIDATKMRQISSLNLKQGDSTAGNAEYAALTNAFRFKQDLLLKWRNGNSGQGRDLRQVRSTADIYFQSSCDRKRSIW